MTRTRLRRVVWGFPLATVVLMALLSIAGTRDVPREVAERRLAQAYGASVGRGDFALDESLARLARLAADPAQPGPHQDLLTLPPGSTTVNGGGRILFPHVADGLIPGTNRFIKTTFIFVNDSFYSCGARLEFLDDNGNEMPVTIGGVKDWVFNFTVAPFTTTRLETSGQGALAVGSAAVICTQSLAGAASFSIRDPQGNVFSDVACSESVLSTEFTLFADTMGQADTGLALANRSTGVTVDLTIELYTLAGALVATQSSTLPGGGHRALYVTELFSSVAGIQEFEGTVVIKGSRQFAGMTLRTVGEQWTSAPMVLAADPNDLRTRMAFPQVGDGTATGLTMRTTILLFNNSAATATGTVEFLKSDGTPMTVTIGGETASSFNYSLNARGSRRLLTSGAGDLRVGWARVRMDNPIHGCAMYHMFSDPAGRLLTEVGVGASRFLQQFNVIADSLGAARTGFGLANPDESGAETDVTLTLFDSQGVQKGEKTITLQAGRHQARFLDEAELFGDVPGINEMDGFVAVFAEGPVVGMSLRQIGTLTTSVPITTPLHGFAPVSVLEPTQNLAGTAPAFGWRIEQPAGDMSLESLEAYLPQCGLNTTGLSPGDSIGYGSYFIHIPGLFSFGGIVKLVVTAIDNQDQSVDFDAVASGPNLQPGQVLLKGSASLDSSDLVLQLGPAGNANGDWNNVMSIPIGLELDLMLRPGLIRAPSSAGSIEIETHIDSASTKFDEAGVGLWRDIVQPQAFVAANTAAPRLHSFRPGFFSPGQAVTVSGEGFTANSVLTLPSSEGGITQAQPLTVDATKMEALVPADAVPGLAHVDNGAAVGNSMYAPSFFNPVMTVARTNPGGGASVLMKVTVATPERQLGMQQFTMSLFNVTRTLSGLAVDTLVGSGKLTGMESPTSTVEYDLKVQSSAANQLVLKVTNKGGSTANALITIEPIVGGASGFKLAYVPATLSETPAVYAVTTQLELNFSGLAFNLAKAQSTPLWMADVVSGPSDLYGAGTGLHVSPIGGILN